MYAIVAASGGDYTTVQDAHDANEVSIWVNAGFSGTGFTLSNNATEVQTGPGVTFSSGINITGNNCSFIGGPGCTVSGEIDVTTGVEAFIEFQNGGTLQNIDINTARCYVNGGGWGTQPTLGAFGSIDFLGADCLIENIAPASLASISGGARGVLRLIKLNTYHYIHSSGHDQLLIGWYSAGDFVRPEGTLRVRLIGNYCVDDIYQTTPHASGSSDWVFCGNVIQGTGDTFPSGYNNNVFVGNRIDGAITDTGATSTIAANDETTF